MYRQEDKYNGAEEWKANQTKDHDEEGVKAESPDEEEEEEEEESTRRSSKKTDSTSATIKAQSANATISDVSSEVLDDVIKLHVRRSSRSKHHRNKTKHHKDKRKKRRHSKNGSPEDVSNVNGSECARKKTLETQNASAENTDLSNCDATSVVVSELDTKLKLDVESSGINTKDVESATTKTEHVDSVRFISDVNNTSNDTRCDAKAVGVAGESDRDTIDDNKSTRLQFNDATTSSLPKRVTCNDDLSKNVEYLNSTGNADPIEVQTTNATERKIKNAPHGTDSQEYKEGSCNVSQSGEPKDVEDRKLKRKRKRPRHDGQAEENVARDVSENTTEEVMFKHRRKKHKHTNEHKTKKHHDVRKAPQDGIVVQKEAQDTCTPEAELLSSTGSTGRIGETADGVMSEPQRLAIKIKLCQECNSRHLQDACPLSTPQYTIDDAITYDNWLNKHKENAEVLKAIKSEDPMSEGYGRLTEDGFESDDESLSGEQSKSKSKVQREEKQLVVDVDRPLYARDSLPDCLELKITNTDHGLGIYAKNPVPMYSKLGPLIGILVREMDIPDDFSMRHIWEVDYLYLLFFIYLIRYL